MQFSVYNFNTGEILRSGDCPAYDVHLQAINDDEHVLTGEKIDDTIWYLPEGVKTPRPKLEVASEYTIAADGVDAVEFALPTGSMVEDCATGEVWSDEDEFYVSTEVVSTHRYRVWPAFPVQGPFEVTIHAS